VRTLLILVALACAYFGCWELTKRRGCSQLPQSWSPAPLLICSDGYRTSEASMGIVTARVLYPCRNVDLWLFGPRIRVWQMDRAEDEKLLDIKHI
jgi:hypothetical protein